MGRQDFNQIADDFSHTINQTKRHIRIPLFYKLIRDITAGYAADFGCGDGFFTRLLAGLGFKKVIGVDSSESLIQKARQFEEEQRLGIEYVLADVRFLNLKNKFDIIAAVYLLDYAQTKEELRSMLVSVYNHLVDNGKFCAIVPHPELKPMKKFEYGRRITSVDGKKLFSDGGLLRCEIRDEKGNQVILNFYYWSKSAYEECLAEVGFKRIEWVEPVINEEAIKTYRKKYWEKLRKNPSSIGLICFK